MRFSNRNEIVTKIQLSCIALCLVCASEAFQVTTNPISSWKQLTLKKKFTTCVNTREIIYRKGLKMTFDGIGDEEQEEDDDDDDDEYINDDSLGDWRTFRSTLVGNSLSTEGNDITEQETKEKSKVSANVELLFTQSDDLGEEYLSGAWAHEAPDIEVGGLVVRLPIEAEIYRGRKKTAIGKVLAKRLDVEDEGSNASSYLSLGSDSKKSSPNFSFSVVGAQTLLWYKKAQKLIEEEMLKIADGANDQGEIDPKYLAPASLSLLETYIDHQNSWQEVCLVADRDFSKGTATTLVLNRPMAFSVGRDLARLVLFGGSISDKLAASQSKLLVSFLSAFQNTCAVYVGGPDKMDEPAIMIHGFADLEGAVEIAPGTKVYKGGVSAAVEGILSGKYNPLDFRFFVGRYDYENGDLDVAVHLHKYQSIACARPIILKQCIQLPKPLWHEVLEMCGGELKEISKLELLKRDDVQEE